MTRAVKLYDLPISTNSTKVRLALGYKGIPCERIPVVPDDRTALVKVSGQPLAPVLVDGETVIFDSSAILRYLDANFRDTPRLFAESREEMKAIEEWEHFAGHEPGKAIGAMFGEMRAATKNPDAIRKANELLNSAADRVEEALAGGPWLLGNRLTAADVTLAPRLYAGMLPPAAVEKMPLLRFFADNLRLEGHPRTRAWVGRVMAYDR
jgi:glutathione S-transferase